MRGDDGQCEFQNVRKKAELFYQSVGELFCPALKSKIKFNSDGFHHLRYDNSRAERSKPEQKNKLLFLKKAIVILQVATTIQEYRKTVQAVGKVRQDGFRKTSLVEYFGFVAITNLANGIRVKVIVRKMGDGDYHFWSLMPLWRQERITNNQVARFVSSKEIEDE
ncbi:hypothetical protein A2482_03365 [Candidatus Falkowbacteria bacterium RIFOXYC2_FULL_48_21]|uniref:Uncharacterized protein n=1 Tax=Candidatus Falkowbacteria bacterium RIFOXYC2_FULL_48_21 TaxID=1798005 RepID=A0A1F5TAD3_9BACT|nr:MAG: hypothetical protein A2482_03365 [Candidatus Falkowbacteria bacterium RIFOXYC2_FULL_48_21]